MRVRGLRSSYLSFQKRCFVRVAKATSTFDILQVLQTVSNTIFAHFRYTHTHTQTKSQLLLPSA